jgi:hypothetical protein
LASSCLRSRMPSKHRMVRVANRALRYFTGSSAVADEGIEEFRNPEGNSAKFHKNVRVR